MGVLNLAHASFFMLSAYLGFQFVSMTGNFWLALLLAPLATAICGVLMERFLLTKVHAFGHMGELILTLGVAQIILAAVKGIWGTESLPLKMPPILEGRVTFAGLDYPIYRLFIIGLALAILGASWRCCSTRRAWARSFAPRCPTPEWSMPSASTFHWSS